MEVKDQNLVGGSLQISTDVIAKIARLAALEVDGVREVKACPYSMKSLLGRLATPKPVEVTLQDEVAEITVTVTIAYDARLPRQCGDHRRGRGNAGRGRIKPAEKDASLRRPGPVAAGTSPAGGVFCV